MISEFIDTHPDINVQEKEYKRLLGFPENYVLDGRVLELADRARQWYEEHGRPWIYARKIDGLDSASGRLRINGATFSSKRLCDQLVDAQADHAMLVAVTAGKECEEKARQLWQEGKPDEYFFMEVYGSAVVEHLITTAGARFCEWADQHGMAILPHYSPGYPGWDIADQNNFLKLIRQKKSRDFPEEIHVLDSGMLQPKKSLLALFGITSHVDRIQRLTTLIPCENCSIPACQYRRVPRKHSQRQIEDVRRLQFTGNSNLDSSALPPQAKYSISSRALRKWSQERLRLKILDDRSVEAQFRYEGTTCSNMGRSLEYDYHIKLGSSEEGYNIVDARCVPAPGDTGHTYMCQYLEDPETLTNKIENEKPMLGKPLNDVLTWERPFTPSGCYCLPASREYKWGLVFEVLHYALAHSQETNDDKQDTL
jgi:hypothetical protein